MNASFSLCAVNRNLKSAQSSDFDHKLFNNWSRCCLLTASPLASSLSFECDIQLTHGSQDRARQPAHTASTAPEYSPRKTAKHPPLTPSNMQSLYCAGGHVYNNIPLPPSPYCLLYSHTHTLFRLAHTHLARG